MANHVCPWWVGYLLLLPLRRLRQSPRKWLGRFVTEGMVVLEPGPGMGFFTLDLARMVGASGRVVAVDVQKETAAARMTAAQMMANLLYLAGGLEVARRVVLHLFRA